jgi:HK97 family phage major capsid protein
MNYETKVAEALNGLVSIQRHLVGFAAPGENLAEHIMKSDQMRSFNEGSDAVRIPLPSNQFKTAIIGAGTQNDPLGFTNRAPVAEGARRRMFLRDLLSAGTTDQAAVEYPTESSYTDTADAQDRENTAFTESGATFGLSFEPSQTIGHFVTVSKNVLDDSNVLDVYLRNTLLYGLRLEEERQILSGVTANSELNGLIAQATAYAVQSPNLTNEIDIIRNVVKQLQLADFSPQAVLLNPQDWYDIDVRKVGSSDDEYVGGDPAIMSEDPRLWRLPVIPTNSIASGTFLVGDFARGAVLFDREQAAVEISRHHDENFKKGMITMLVTERASLVTTNAAGLVTGSL